MKLLIGVILSNEVCQTIKLVILLGIIPNFKGGCNVRVALLAQLHQILLIGKQGHCLHMHLLFGAKKKKNMNKI